MLSPRNILLNLRIATFEKIIVHISLNYAVSIDSSGKRIKFYRIV